MTHEQLEGYIIQLLPSFRRKYVKIDDDDDLLQLTLIDLHKKCCTLDAPTEKAFTDLFMSYYRMHQFRRRSHIAEAIKIGSYLRQFMGDYQREAVVFETQYNPWETPLTQALEYIQCVDNPRWQAMMYMYYIEGYTMKEIAVAYRIAEKQVFKTLEKAVKRIQKVTAANS